MDHEGNLGGVWAATGNLAGLLMHINNAGRQEHGLLGDLWRPKYIVGGMAIHGYPHVPAFPASHGCIRVSNAAMDHLWATRLLPLGSSVWVY